MATATGPATQQSSGGYSGNWRKLSEVGAWASQQQARTRRYAIWIDLVTTSIEGTFKRSAGKRLRDKAAAAFKAKRAVRQWRRAAAHMDAAADCFARGWKDTLTQFPELIDPARQLKDPFKWDA